ncbi:SLAM family member 9 [Triplophysa dalaica]|uniref:SLAM family member 9 n=1 Tax=Triplophysa dalaica TaxID=1582913 RepID=UPI0024DFF6E5|nr:SLAM family member 9 [Triplophysa dalaica]
MIHALILMRFCLLGVFGDTEEVKISVMEGESVTLHTDLTHIQTDLEIEWRFEKIRIARIKRSVNIDPTYDNETEIFRENLKMNNQTGDLTITHITSQHSGLYKLNIFTGNKQKVKSFSLTAYAPLPTPVITSDVSHCSSSKCVLLCSVMNVRDVTLSWHNGSRTHSSINVSEQKSISLPLEVEYQDTNTYSCVINNPISNQTKPFCLADLCRPCSDVTHSCGTVEASMRLVVTAVMGVAAVAAVIVLSYDIRSRRDELKRKSHTSPTTTSIEE